MAETFAEFVALDEKSTWTFDSKHYPVSMGNLNNIAYGGCALATAVHAAHRTVSSQFHLYSIVGYYLGPSITTANLRCTVRTLRDTRTFATRQVEVTQRQGSNDSYRSVMTLLADFQVAEPASALVYSAQPLRTYSPPERSQTLAEVADNLVERGDIQREIADKHKEMFGLTHRYFETRSTPEGVFTQQLTGVAKHLPTTQDHLNLTDKTSGDWIRGKNLGKSAKEGESEQALQCTALAFLMDGGLSFMPLTHNHMFLQDVDACSTLDFAMRLFTNEVDFSNWHFREIRTIVGECARTYSEGRIWSGEQLVACMNQQSILRPKKLKGVAEKSSL